MRPAPLILACAWLATGCEKAMHDMYAQPRYDAYSASRLFSDGTSARVPPEGIAPHAGGPFAGTSSGRAGLREVERDEQAAAAGAIPYPMTAELLERGRDRFDIFCVPCHSPVGDGDGLVVRRGFPRPPSYHIERLRQAPDRHFFDVATDGYGVMPSYAGVLSPPDRWAVVAYIRALQLSQDVDLRDLPPDLRARLDKEAGR